MNSLDDLDNYFFSIERTRLHLEKLLPVQEYLAARGVISSVTQVAGAQPVLVAGKLQIAYDDVTWKYNSQIGEWRDSAFSPEALCLTALGKLKGTI